MRRKTTLPSRSSAANSVSLFPFLAVLVCTMGALIVLMMVINRQAKRQAVAAATSRQTEEVVALESDREMTQWRLEQLAVSRKKTETQLAEARLQLGHLEDHSRRLAKRAAELEATWRDLDEAGRPQREQFQAELARVDQQRRTLEVEHATARQAMAQRKPGYCVIPYNGPHGTQRRPIYIECRDDAVVLQPLGVVLTASDFEGPMGPANPLASGLRAMREYWVRSGYDPEKEGEPYPLLLVRPEGVAAYYAAREALKSWGNDYGYELIGSDWELQYPPRDPNLVDVVHETVKVARAEQRALVAAAPRSYQGGPRGRFRAAPGGGIVCEGRPAGGGPPGHRHDDQRWRSAPSRPALAEVYGGAAAGSAETRSGQPGEAKTPGQPGQPNAPGQPNVSGQPGQGNPTAAPTCGAGQAPAMSRELAPPPRERDLARAAEASSADGGEPRRPGQWEPEPPRSAKPLKLAETRGEQWALRDATAGAVPVTRPLRVECYQDRLVLMPDRGSSGVRVIPLGPRTETSIDTLVSAVWEQMDTWGIAGRKMYWRPILNVYVMQNGQSRFADLSALMEGSGFEVVRKGIE